MVFNAKLFFENMDLNNLNKIFKTNLESKEQLTDKCSTIDDLLSKLFDLYVPGEGMADTVVGECIRAINRVAYRYYNDGDLVGYGYGVETASSSLGYVVAQIPEVRFIAQRMIDFTDDCDEYKNQLDLLIEKTIETLFTKRINYFDLQNDDDSRDDWSDVLFDNYSERLHYPEEDEYDDCY